MAAPDPADCSEQAHVGRIHHDPDEDVWYECVFDARRSVVTWAILPPEDVQPGL